MKINKIWSTSIDGILPMCYKGSKLISSGIRLFILNAHVGCLSLLSSIRPTHQRCCHKAHDTISVSFPLDDEIWCAKYVHVRATAIARGNVLSELYSNNPHIWTTLHAAKSGTDPLLRIQIECQGEHVLR